MDSDSGSRVLGAANDLVDLLRLAGAAAERISQETFGPAYEHAELLTRELQRLRRSAAKLSTDIESFVSREEGATVDRGFPLRRASDHSRR